MNENEKAAFIMAQSALLNAEIAMMIAANTERLQRGEGMPYGEEEFAGVLKNYEGTLGHNPCLEFLQGT